MEWDELAEEKSRVLFASWLTILTRESPALLLRLAGEHRPGHVAVEASEFMTGSYNVCGVVTFDDGFKAVVRLPILGRSRLRIEKTNDELIATQYLTPRTPVPIPKVLGTGMWDFGPYIVTAYVEGIVMSDCLKDPARKHPGLRPDISDTVLRQAYQGMARVMLDLYKVPFPRIGSIGYDGTSWKVSKRPLTLNMNELVRVANVPPREFRQGNFSTASEYFQELAEHHFLHLKYQRNNAIKDEQDCRKKYIARCLFRRLVREMPAENAPFRLYCDDFRPSNVIVPSESDLTVSAVIDWEFTYAAPAEFSHAAPWWLLLESPEAWESDLHNFLDRYKPRLELFLEAMKACEDERIRAGSMQDAERLSAKMAESMVSGLFWFCLAARKGYIFDEIYWDFLDERYFGPLGALDDRLPLLTEDERDGLEGFVREKLQQMNDGGLDEHLTPAEVLVL